MKKTVATFWKILNEIARSDIVTKTRWRVTDYEGRWSGQAQGRSARREVRLMGGQATDKGQACGTERWS
jgi:hypothetical protein